MVEIKKVTIYTIQFLIFLAAIFVSAWLVPNLRVNSWFDLFVFSFLLWTFNFFVLPVINDKILKIGIYTLGFITIFLNAAVFLIVANVLQKGVVFEGGIGNAILVNFIIVLLFSIFTSLLSVKSEHIFEILYVKRFYKKKRKSKYRKGLYFLEIDGLSRNVLEYAINKGYMPTLEKWLKNTHSLVRWECDLSSQTSAAQAGILHGNNDNIPAFRWVNRKTGKIEVSNHPEDTKVIQKRISNGKGLLAIDGISFNNMFDGDSKHLSLGMAGLGSEDEIIGAMRLYFLYPFALINTLLKVAQDIIIDFYDSFLQNFQRAGPRIKRGVLFKLVRPLTTVVLRDLSIYRIVDSMFNGYPFLYTTFAGYDEVAHHCGVKNRTSLNVLKRLDKQFELLSQVNKHTDTKYDFVILSDHGQSEGWTFKQRFGYSLEEYVNRILGANGITDDKRNEEHKQKVKFLFDKISKRKSEKEKVKKVEVLASGNLALVYFSKSSDRISYKEILAKYPGLVRKLKNHKGISFLLIKNDSDEPIVFSKDGELNLKSGKLEGNDPLRKYNSNTLKQHLIRNSSFKNAPDILVMSLYDPKTQEVAAFEELIGSHGGVGGEQNNAFVLFPKTLGKLKGDLIGAEALYKLFKSWQKKYLVD